MSFMSLHITNKGALYTCDCAKCGASMFSHEWADGDHNERRDAMEAGTLRCDECATGRADPATFAKLRAHYAGRYSADGHMDCTSWSYDTNLRRLARDLKDMYGDDQS